MNDFVMAFFIGTIEKLQECGIDTTTLRKSKDGLQAIIHFDLLTMEQFNAIRPKTSIEALTHEQTLERMATSEWSGAMI